MHSKNSKFIYIKKINRVLFFVATKVSLDSEENSSDVLGISAVIVHDLKQRRTRDYKFNWDVALDVSHKMSIVLKNQYNEVAPCL